MRAECVPRGFGALARGSRKASFACPSEEEFKKHFGVKYPITDAKLISNRRIGYVGYKTPEEAAKAVKYFNKSFIRMSKIGVELARPVRSLHTFLHHAR